MMQFVKIILQFLMCKLTIVELTMFIVLTVSGCSDSDLYLLGPQRLDNVDFIVEVRPGPPRKGMNELVVIATGLDRRPAFDYVVSIKLSNSDKWVQSIQDGHSGAYRRAITVNDPLNDIVNVQIKTQAGSSKVLNFPLAK